MRHPRSIGILAWAVSLASPAAANAQALRCAEPSQAERPHPELPSASQPQRQLPIGSYTLALTWSPEYCHGRPLSASWQPHRAAALAGDDPCQPVRHPVSAASAA